jgi:hypothetical protein
LCGFHSTYLATVVFLFLTKQMFLFLGFGTLTRLPKGVSKKRRGLNQSIPFGESSPMINPSILRLLIRTLQ